MGRENRFKNQQTGLNEQTNLCKLETKRFKDYTDLFHAPITRTTNHTCLKISQNWPKLATMFLNIMLPMEVHIHKHSPHWASIYSLQIHLPVRPKVNFFTID